jgi:hypothetical protein
MREWRYGFEACGAGMEAAMGESATTDGANQAHRRDGSVIEHLCIRVYWNLGNKSHEHLFIDGH